MRDKLANKFHHIGDFFDITEPYFPVEVSWSKDRKVLWVHIGVCVLRICRITELHIQGEKMSDKPTPDWFHHDHRKAVWKSDYDILRTDTRKLERERDEAIELLRKILTPPYSSTALVCANAFLARIGKDKP